MEAHNKGQGKGNNPHGSTGNLTRMQEYYYGNGILLAAKTMDNPHHYGYGHGHSHGWGNIDSLKDLTFYHQDILGSVVLLTGHNGQVVERYEYDAYGAAYNGKFDRGLAGMGSNPYGFTGKRYEAELGIYSFAFRDYNPRSMRWLTPDPVMDGLNWYLYCGGDPVNWVDPDGRMAAEALRATQLGYVSLDPITTAVAIIGSTLIVADIVTGGAVTSFIDDTITNISQSNPLKGEPGSTSRTYDKEGNIKQERTYGDDGYPDIDIDYDHDHGQGKPHKHKWKRPEDESPPTHKDRMPGEECGG